ncbi:hypothetical protein M408DRAFT_9517 [Serendipita vermifera MAFF 305830]|uniref:Uncharacterized protein n=1 Tax=Serendipita vermifera MAFF 305830 TaxID=933852 RepID=A0A0C2XDK8_SERVB|nr:hypothetical protein M408DRAFT_9517 [Serendipita vermifera MAFF 305830]
MSDSKTTAQPASEGQGVASTSANAAPERTKSQFSFGSIKRSASKMIQSKEGQSSKNLIKGYGRTMKVGSQFKKGTSEMLSAAEELRDILGVSAKDVLVVVDQKLRTGKDETTKTADILRSAGEDAIVVVTTSLLNSRAQFEANAPQLKHTVLKNSKDCVVIVDKAIKNPVVITGVTKFAKAQGIPRPEAILTVAAWGVGKLIKILDEAEGEARVELEKFEAEVRQRQLEVEHESGDVVVIDASEFEKHLPKEEARVAKEIGHAAAPPSEGGAPAGVATGAPPVASPSEAPAEPAVPGALPDKKGKGKEKKEKDDGCIIM